MGTALLAGVVDWAGRHGFHTRSAQWASANLVSDAFWRGHGFTPARHTLVRRIDPRVAWGGPTHGHSLGTSTLSVSGSGDLG